MNSFDSMKFEIPENIVQNWDCNYFDLLEKTNPITKGKTHYYKTGFNLKPLPIGIGQIEYSNGTFKTSISAKILRDNYFEGINRNTINQVIDNLRPVLNVNFNDFISTDINLFTVDATNNIDISTIANKSQCIYTLKNSVKNIRFDSKVYFKKNNQGVVITGDQNFRARLIAYNKEIELNQKKNELFLSQLDNPELLLNRAKNILRLETNFANLPTIRAKIIGNKNSLASLKNCLMSDIKVNYNFLMSIVANGTKQLTIFDIMNDNKIEKTTGIEIFTQFGIDAFIKEFKYDEKSIKKFLQTVFPNPNTFYYHWAKKENSIQSRIVTLKEKDEISSLKNETTLTQILDNLKNQ
jgi:hypothetical protein